MSKQKYFSMACHAEHGIGNTIFQDAGRLDVQILVDFFLVLSRV
jgi:hypothetical protein